MQKLPITVFLTALVLALVTAAASWAQLDWLFWAGRDSAPVILLGSLSVMCFLLPSLMPLPRKPLAGALALPLAVVLVMSALSTSGYGILAIWLSLPFSFLLLFTVGLPLIWKAIRGSFVSCLPACLAGILCTVPAIVLHFMSFPANAGKNGAYFLLWAALGAASGMALLWRRHSASAGVA